MNRIGPKAMWGVISDEIPRFTQQLMLLFLMASLSSVPRPTYSQSPAGEYQVKAAFIFHFAQLVDWPNDPATGSSLPISLCVFDDEPNLQSMESTVEGKQVGARVLHVRPVHSTQDIHGCDILFLSRNQSPRQKDTLSSLRGLPVLTVGETDDFLRDGGMIRFHLEADRIRFDINLAAADAAGIKISSRLLLLATQVLRGPGKGM